MDTLVHLSDLLRQRNAIDAQIADLIGRPASPGHVGEWIAASVFGIELHRSASTKANDGYFRSGPLAGHSVNVKWYGKHEGLMDISSNGDPDFYLVITGPKVAAISSRGLKRPAVIESVFLFDGTDLLNALQARGVKIGVATSVIGQLWRAAEIYPEARNPNLPLSDEQRRWLALFHDVQ